MTEATYMTILKGKRGELAALRELGAREGIYPIIEIPRIPWDYDENVPAKSIETHVKAFLRPFEKTLSSIERCAVDAALLDGGDSLDSTIALREVLRASAELGLPIVPTTGLGRSAHYNRVAGRHAAEHSTGCAIRIEREDLYDPSSLKSGIEDLLAKLRLTPEAVDVIADLKFLREENEQADLDFAMRTLPLIPYQRRWRSFWFAGGSFPEFLTNIEKDSEEYIPRLEWTIWNGLARGLRTQRVPRFGDYGVAHPISPDVDGRIMNMSANIRYTTEYSWLIVKGRSTRSNAKYHQFHTLCQKLVARDEFSGREYSHGDAYLDDCAREVDGPGNATKWRQAGTNHHITYVSEQVEEAKRLLP